MCAYKLKRHPQFFQARVRMSNYNDEFLVEYVNGNYYDILGIGLIDFIYLI
jgi:hypothetical protein